LSGALISTAGNVSAAGNVQAQNFIGNLIGNVSIAATSANSQVLFNSSGIITGDSGLTFDFSANALTVGGALVTTNSGNLSIDGAAQVVGNIATTTGNLISGNALVTTLISAGGNVVGGNLTTAGLITATGNITSGNVNTAGLASVGGNVIGGNISTGGLITATGNITGGNINTGAQVVATGNITGGNFQQQD
jgi:hypothetical protein